MADDRRVYCSLTRGDFGGGPDGNLEAVLRFGGTLRHFHRDSRAGMAWREGRTIVGAGVAGPGCIIQSDLGSGTHGNFEVVVPVTNPAGGMDLRHFFHDNSRPDSPWQPGQVVAPGVAGPGCIIQSDLGSGTHGNFEVVVPVTNPAGGMDLRHFFHDNSRPDSPWQPGQVVAPGVAGPGCIIQSDLGSGTHGNFEVVVPVTNPAGGMDLRHFFHDNSRPDSPWQPGQVVAPGVAGPGCIIQSDLGSGTHGNFEVVVPLPYGDACQLRHFFHDSSDMNLPWRRAQFVTDCAGGWAGLASSSHGRRGRRSLEVLIEERSSSVVAYFHHNRDVTSPWLRDAVLDGEPLDFIGGQTHRICQVTGEWDRTGWAGTGRPPFAPNRTESRCGIRGTDLGVSFEHRGKTFFLFGDTARAGRPPWEAMNAIAWTDTGDPSNGLPLSFLPTWPRITPPIPQGRFNVPLDGVSDGDAMYVFFSTDAHRVGGKQVMGRSVLTRCTDEGLQFQLLRTLSSYRFINVSIQRGALDEQGASALGWEPGLEVLWIWGSGRYRSSDIYLAAVPFDQLGHDGLFDLRFFCGDRGSPRWSSLEEDATPVILNGAVGELSVRWNAPLQRFLAIFNSDNPRATLLHSAERPWGPWTPEPVGLFDATRLSDPDNPCSGAGYGNFMHVPWTARRCDHVHDNAFGRWRTNEWGGEYASYQIGHMSTPTDDGCVLYYLLSTWNPYQVMLMATPVTRTHVP